MRLFGSIPLAILILDEVWADMTMSLLATSPLMMVEPVPILYPVSCAMSIIAFLS